MEPGTSWFGSRAASCSCIKPFDVAEVGTMGMVLASPFGSKALMCKVAEGWPWKLWERPFGWYAGRVWGT